MFLYKNGWFSWKHAKSKILITLELKLSKNLRHHQWDIYAVTFNQLQQSENMARKDAIAESEETDLQCRGLEGPSKRHIPVIQESRIGKES